MGFAIPRNPLEVTAMSFLLSLLTRERPTLVFGYIMGADGQPFLGTDPTVNPRVRDELLEALRDAGQFVPNDTVILFDVSEGELKVTVNNAPLHECQDRGVLRMVERLESCAVKLFKALEVVARMNASEDNARSMLLNACGPVLSHRLVDGSDLTDPIQARVVCPSCAARHEFVSSLFAALGEQGTVEVPDRDDDGEQVDDGTMQLAAPVPHSHPFYDALCAGLQAWVDRVLPELVIMAAREMRDHTMSAMRRLEVAFDLPPYVQPPAEDAAVVGDEPHVDVEAGGGNTSVEPPAASLPTE